MAGKLRALPEEMGSLFDSLAIVCNPQFQGDLTPSSGLCGHSIHVVYRYIHNINFLKNK